MENHFSNLRRGIFVVMPNHVHGIIAIERATRHQKIEVMDRDEFGGNDLISSPDGSPLRLLHEAFVVGATCSRGKGIMDHNDIITGIGKGRREGSPKEENAQHNGPAEDSLGAHILKVQGLTKQYGLVMIIKLISEVETSSSKGNNIVSTGDFRMKRI